MKFLSTEQQRQADAVTIANEPISSIDLMERAAGKWLDQMLQLYPDETDFYLFCGMGNNGGDGLVIARKLALLGKSVKVFLIQHSEKGSPDFEKNLARMPAEVSLTYCLTIKGIKPIDKGIIIDAMLGSGLTRPLSGVLDEAAAFMNRSRAKILAVDLPSGMFDRNNSQKNRELAVKADVTITFQCPKICMICPEDSENIGDWYVVDIGLDQSFIESCNSQFYLFEGAIAGKILHKRNRQSHKGNFGHALLAAGSKGKIGAVVLAAEACLRSGVGLLTVAVPACGYSIIQSAVPEAMAIMDPNEDLLTETVAVDSFQAVGIGPGIGTSPETKRWLEEQVKISKKPIVLDADALNILSKNKSLLSRIPPGSILTPHPKEFERLFGATNSSEDAFDKMIQESKRLQVVIVRKGHHSAVSYPDGTCWFNTSGNPGMAKGGSGDALTGVILALLAQGYTSEYAASLGVFLHGLAGDLAAADKGQESMLPSDLIQCLGAAFQATHQLNDK